MDQAQLPKEPLIYSFMSRVAGQIGKIATRTAQVVAGTLTPSRTDTRAPDLAATASLMTRNTLSFIPPGRRRGHVGIDQRFLND